MQTLIYHAGRPFLFSRQINLPFGTAWAARSEIRLENGDFLSDLSVEKTGEETVLIVISAPETVTRYWPRPAKPGDIVIFYFDYEVFDPDGDTLMSSETVKLLVEYVPPVGDCPAVGEFVEREIARLATQYREATKLQAYMRAVLGEVELAARAVCAIPDYFDIYSAVGDQLTLIGQWMGFPRCHCVCISTSVFGFPFPDAGDYPRALTGFCESGSWDGCDGSSAGTLCLSDDEVYRKFLMVRRYQMLALFDRESLLASIRTFWGPNARIVQDDRCTVVVAPGRPIGADEIPLLQIIARVLPVAPGITLKSWLDPRPIFGFGEGYAGFCEVSSTKVFGFDCGNQSYEMAGFCDDTVNWADCVPRGAGFGVWLCPEDMKSIC